MPEAQSGRVFELTPSGSSATLVLKLFDSDAPWQLAQEALVYEYLRRAGVPTPAVLATDPSRELIGTDWMIMSRVAGEIVAALDPLTPEDARAIYRRIGATLRTIHSISFEHYGYFDRAGPVDPLATDLELMRVCFDRDLRRFSEAGGPPALRGAIERRIAAADDVFEASGGAVLCHGDLHEANILVSSTPDGFRVTGVVDVGGAIAADPLFDLARTDYWSTRGDAEKRAGLREGYGVVRRADCERAIAVYSLHHALELWNWFARAPGEHETLSAITSELERLAIIS